MRNLLQKKLNRKGFTLAELLIVVAIIAILVAIAMPIFFGALEKAERAVYDADVRSLKAAGIAYILYNHDDTSKVPPASADGWTITGTVSVNGDITGVSVAAASGDETTDYDTEWKTRTKNAPVTLKVTVKETVTTD